MLPSRRFYPSLFRVLIALVLIADVLSSLFFESDLYHIPNYVHQMDNYLPFLKFLRENIQFFLLTYLAVLTLWLLGIGKQLGTLFLCIFYIIEFYLIFPGVFWGDYVLRITLLFFVAVDGFQFFSFAKHKHPPTIIHKLAVLAIMFNLCMVYWENAYFKFSNDEWTSGYALAYFFEFSQVLDIFNIGDMMMKNSWLIRLSTWSVLFFQLTFPFVLWTKRLKYLWIIIGILIHLLMAVTLQLYKFELIIILLYGFFITDNEWQWLIDRLNLKLDIIHGKR